MLGLVWIAHAGLDKALLAAVKGGAKVTILAPSNAAFKRLMLKCPVKNVLLDHVIPQLLPASAVLAAPVGFTVCHRSTPTHAPTGPLLYLFRVLHLTSQGLRATWALFAEPSCFLGPQHVWMIRMKKRPWLFNSHGPLRGDLADPLLSVLVLLVAAVMN